MGKTSYTYRISVEEPKERRPLGRHKHRLDDNIKIDLKKCGVDCTHFAQNVGAVFKRLDRIFGAQKISKTCWVKNNSVQRSKILLYVLLFFRKIS